MVEKGLGQPVLVVGVVVGAVWMHPDVVCILVMLKAEEVAVVAFVGKVLVYSFDDALTSVEMCVYGIVKFVSLILSVSHHEESLIYSQYQCQVAEAFVASKQVVDLALQ